MKKILLTFSIIVFFIFGACQKYDEEINKINDRLDSITSNNQIASLKQQIDAINASLPQLGNADNELKKYIAELQEARSALVKAQNENKKKIEAIREELDNNAPDGKSEVLAQLEKIRGDLQQQITVISNTLKTLQQKDADLEKQIMELKKYVATISDNSDLTAWADATFATLEHYNTLVTDIATVKEQMLSLSQSVNIIESRINEKISRELDAAVTALNASLQQNVRQITDAYTLAVSVAKDDITRAYTAAIQTAVADAKHSLQQWVSEKMSGFCTIAEVQAKLNAVLSAISDGDNVLRGELEDLSEELEVHKTSITEAYKKAIDDAIKTNNGVVDGKIESEINSVNEKIDGEIAAINLKIKAVEERVGLVERKVATIEEQIGNINVSISSLEQVTDQMQASIQNLSREEQANAETVKWLKDKSSELETLILGLKEYAETELAGMTNWANATFATLGQYNTLVSELESIKAFVTLNDTQHTEALGAAIEESETLMKSWIGTQLDGYCTIAKLNGTISVLEGAIASGDESLQFQIEQLKTTYSNIRNEFTGAYMAAIQSAIEENNGVINTKISTEINSLNSRITSEVESLNLKINGLDSRLGAVEGQIQTILGQIGSISQTIEILGNTDKELREYIISLQGSAGSLQQSRDEINKKIEELEEALQASGNEYFSKSEVMGLLATAKSELQNEIDQLNNTCAILLLKDSNLEAKIYELQTYVDSELADTKDWIEGTFATLEQWNTLAGEVVSVKTYIQAITQSISSLEERMKQKIADDIAVAVAGLDADIQEKVSDITSAYTTAIAQVRGSITSAYTEAIGKSISELENSMKGWVSGQLSGYYKMAEADALLAAMYNEYTSGLNSQKAYFEGVINSLEDDLNASVSQHTSQILALTNFVGALQGVDRQHTDAITNNATSIANNAQSISHNASLIQTNADAIDDIGSQIANIMVSLNAGDAAANTKIEALQSALEQKIKENKDLVSANSTSISANSAAIAANEEAIKALQISNATILKNVNDIAQNAADIAINASLISANAASISNNAMAIGANTNEILLLKQNLEKAKTEIEQNYKAAIDAAIKEHRGVLRGDIASAIAEVNAAIDAKVAEINNAIHALESRVVTLEYEMDAVQASIQKIMRDMELLKNQITNLVKHIQSVTYIPKYSDGKATMLKTVGEDNGIAEFDFLISPKEAVKDIAANWQSILSMKAVYTITRAVSFIDMPVLSFAADEATGVISVQVSGENLSEDFYAASQSASAALFISDGNNSITSEYVEMLGFSTNYITIKDANFRNYLIANFDADHNNQISLDEAASVQIIDCRGVGITDISGLESFINLEELYMSDNYISTINLDNILSLKIIDLDNNNITGKLDLRNHTALEYLYLKNCDLEEIILNDKYTYSNITVTYNYKSTKVKNASGNIVSKYFIGQYITDAVEGKSSGSVVYGIIKNGANCCVISAEECYGTNANEVKSLYDKYWSVPSSGQYEYSVLQNIRRINKVLSHYGHDTIDGAYMSSTDGEASGRYVSITYDYDASTDEYSYSIYKYTDSTYEYKYRLTRDLLE